MFVAVLNQFLFSKKFVFFYKQIPKRLKKICFFLNNWIQLDVTVKVSLISFGGVLELKGQIL